MGPSTMDGVVGNKPYLVIVVDDQEYWRDKLSHKLQDAFKRVQKPVDVRTFASFGEARSRLTNGEGWDLLVADVHLHGPDDPELAGQDLIRIAVDNAIPAIATSVDKYFSATRVSSLYSKHGDSLFCYVDKVEDGPLQDAISAFVANRGAFRRYAVVSAASPTALQTKAVVAAPPTVDPVYEALTKLDRVSLADCRVVDEYYRYDEPNRVELTAWKETIEAALLANDNSPDYYLVWGNSGSGKTAFVKSIGSSLASAVLTVKVNVAEDDKPKMDETVAKADAAGTPVLFIIDEVNTPFARIPISYYFSMLPDQPTSPHKRVFALLGSNKRGRQAMIDQIRDIDEKGNDLLNRILPDNHIDVPDFTLEERAVLMLARAFKDKAHASDPVNQVQKAALYYILSEKGYEMARPLMLLTGAALRTVGNRKKLVLGDFFDLSNKDRFETAVKYWPAMSEFWNRYVKVTE
jgi:hypothetical protein